MVIYDKNQFKFNIIFLFVLFASIILNVIFAYNFLVIDERHQNITDRLTQIEDNQNFNFIQGSHYDLNYQLTPQGFFIPRVDNFGLFNGLSMQPAIFDKNIVLEKDFNLNQTLEEGQIVRYIRKEDGKAVIHRVRADYGKEVFIQGDALKEGEMVEKARITHTIVGVLFT